MIMLLISGCSTLIGYDGSYKGKVINADTNEPIEGAVAHGIWFDLGAPFLMGNSTYVDSREVITDSGGNFVIQGQGIKILSNLDVMEVTIFKAGYESGNFPTWPRKEIYSPKYLEEYKHIFELQGDSVVFKLKPIINGKHPWYDFVRLFDFEPKEKRRLIDSEVAKDKTIK